MSLAQKVHGDNNTFAELSDAIFMSALRTGVESSRIDLVFDVYLEIQRMPKKSTVGQIAVFFSATSSLATK